jgi:hypothetical protein
MDEGRALEGGGRSCRGPTLPKSKQLADTQESTDLADSLTTGEVFSDTLIGMKPNDIQAFMRRGWDRKEALKREYWAEQHQERGASATLDASMALRDHLVALRPDWPTAEDRAADLRHHLELIAKLEQSADAFSSR